MFLLLLLAGIVPVDLGNHFQKAVQISNIFQIIQIPPNHPSIFQFIRNSLVLGSRFGFEVRNGMIDVFHHVHIEIQIGKIKANGLFDVNNIAVVAWEGTLQSEFALESTGL